MFRYIFMQPSEAKAPRVYWRISLKRNHSEELAELHKSKLTYSKIRKIMKKKYGLNIPLWALKEFFRDSNLPRNKGKRKNSLGTPGKFGTELSGTTTLGLASSITFENITAGSTTTSPQVSREGVWHTQDSDLWGQTPADFLIDIDTVMSFPPVLEFHQESLSTLRPSFSNHDYGILMADSHPNCGYNKRFLVDKDTAESIREAGDRPPESLTTLSKQEYEELREARMRIRNADWEYLHGYDVAALREYESALEIYLKLFGPDAIATLDLQYKKHRTMRWMRAVETKREMQILEEVCQAFENRLGPEHLKTRLSYNLLGIRLEDEGYYEKSIEALYKALNDRDIDAFLAFVSLDKMSDKIVALSADCVARICYMQGRSDDASRLGHLIVKQYKREHRSKPKENVNNNIDLALSYMAQNTLGKFMDALNLLERASEFEENRNAAAGPPSVALIVSDSARARCLFHLGCFEDARKVSDTVHDRLYQELLASDHPLLLNRFAFNLLTLGNLRALYSNWRSAMYYFEAALWIYSSRLSQHAYPHGRYALSRLQQARVIIRGPIMYMCIQPLVQPLENQIVQEGR